MSKTAWIQKREEKTTFKLSSRKLTCVDEGSNEHSLIVLVNLLPERKTSQACQHLYPPTILKFPTFCRTFYASENNNRNILFQTPQRNKKIQQHLNTSLEIT